MGRVQEVVGLAVLSAEPQIHKEVLRYAGAGTRHTADLRADTRRFYDVLGFDVILQERLRVTSPASCNPNAVGVGIVCPPDEEFRHNATVCTAAPGCVYTEAVRTTELHPYVLEINFNPDPSLYHKEDVRPRIHHLLLSFCLKFSCLSRQPCMRAGVNE
jgi:hypothetical protein